MSKRAEKNKDILFKAKTNNGHCIKTIAELLQSNIMNGCFRVNKKGIFLKVMDDKQRNILIELELSSDRFENYMFQGKQDLLLGINFSQFAKMLKSVKKKEYVQLCVTKSTPTDLIITVGNLERSRIANSMIKIQDIQNIDIDSIDGYDEPIIIQSAEFQKMCKEQADISPVINVSCIGRSISFNSVMSEILARSSVFGGSESEDDEDEEEYYNNDFNSDQFKRIIKITGLSKQMRVFVKQDEFMCIRTDIGIQSSIGNISVYLKSKCLQENETRTVESDDEY